MNMLTAPETLRQNARRLAPPRQPLLGIHEYYTDNTHRITHFNDLGQSVVRQLEKEMIKQGPPPCQWPHFYHGVLVIADRPALLADQGLYLPSGFIAGVYHGPNQIVLALYTCEHEFNRVSDRVRAHTASRYDVLKVTCH